MVWKRRMHYGWVVVGVAFLIALVVYGTRNSFSVFFVAILDEFEWTRAGTAFIFSLNILCYGSVASLAGTLADRYGARRVIPVGAVLVGGAMAALSQANALWHFYLLFGVVLPLGMALTGFPVMAPMVANWFMKQRGAALGIFQGGIGFSFLMGILAQFYMDVMGWRLAYVAIGGMATVIALPLAVLFLRHRPSDMKLQADGLAGPEPVPAEKRNPHAEATTVDQNWASVEWTPSRALKTYRFWALFFSQLLFWGLGVYLVLAHQVAFAVDMGYSKVFAASVFGIFGFFQGTGQLCGFISDHLGRERTYTLGTVGVVLGILALVAVTNSSQPWLLYSYAVLLGLFSGMNAPVFAATVADLFYGRHFGAITGLLMVGFGIGGALGPWLGGVIFDAGGSYTPAFVMAMVVCVLGCLCVWVAAPRNVRMVQVRLKAPKSGETP